MLDYFAGHKFISLLVIIAIIGGAWYGLNASFSPSSSSSLATSTPAGGPGGDVVSTLLALRSVNLNGSILSDPLFANLKDFTTQIVTEPFGRANPFTPVDQATLRSALAATGTPGTTNLMLFAPSTKQR